MADNEHPLQAQPDLHRFSQAYRILAEESEKLSNLPAVDAGHTLVAAVQQLTGEVREGFAVQQQLTREVREGFASIRIQIRVIDHNSAARIQNTYVTSPAEPLSPFIGPETGQPIDGFPVTSAEIPQMALQQLNAILQTLGLDTHGARPAKEKRLREHIGLRGQPQQVA